MAENHIRGNHMIWAGLWEHLGTYWGIWAPQKDPKSRNDGPQGSIWEPGGSCGHLLRIIGDSRGVQR